MVRSRGGVVSADQLKDLMDAGLQPSVARPPRQTLDARSFTEGMQEQIRIAWEAKNYGQAAYILFIWLKMCPVPVPEAKPEVA